MNFKVLKTLPQIVDINLNSVIIQELQTPKDSETICNHCGEAIKDDTFIGVIDKAPNNFLLHKSCYPDVCFDPAIMDAGDPACGNCTHAYHRHYDLFEEEEDMLVGCKYCSCMTWVPPKDWKYPNESS